MMANIPNSNQTLTATTNVITYMDDTTWIAPNHSLLEQILIIASSFYNMAKITVNPHKSILFHNKDQDINPILFQNQPIYNLPPKQTFWFLGTYINYTIDNQYVIKKLKQDFCTELNKLKFSKITEKQAIYIINAVLLARLRYQLSNTYLTNLNCQYLIC